MNNSYEEMMWREEVCKRYPYSEEQKKEIRALGRATRYSGTKAICINGCVYEYENKKELVKAYEEAENRKYMFFGIAMKYRYLWEEINHALYWKRTAEEAKRWTNIFYSRPKNIYEELELEDRRKHEESCFRDFEWHLKNAERMCEEMGIPFPVCGI